MKDLSDLGDRVSVFASDLTDEVIQVILKADKGFGNTILQLDQAKKMATKDNTSVASNLEKILSEK